MKFHRIFPILIILITIAIGIYLYPFLPDFLATHWGVDGQVNGYAPKVFALFFMPALSSLLYLLFLFLPHIEPYKKNFLEFDQFFYLFVNLVFAFLFYIYLLTIFWHLGIRFNMSQAISPAIAMLFGYAGILMQHTKQNWFVGIRTPWTLLNDRVWKETHSIGGRMFKISGILAFMALFIPQFAIWLILVPILLSSVFLFFYSYILFRRYNRL